MTASTNRPRTYTASDLQEVMQDIGGHAENWDDAIHYVQQQAVDNSGLSQESVAEMTADLKTLQLEDHSFTTDYRRVWHAISGERLNGSAIEEPDDAHEVDGSATSSSRVLDLLHRLESAEYQQMARDLERFGDRSWNRK